MNAPVVYYLHVPAIYATTIDCLAWARVLDVESVCYWGREECNATCTSPCATRLYADCDRPRPGDFTTILHMLKIAFLSLITFTIAWPHHGSSAVPLTSTACQQHA
eukprot:4852-Heterococcus_DN1.PRE.1